MQKWEYVFVYADRQENCYYVGGIRRQFETSEDIWQVMNRLGREGWELAGTPSAGGFIFKRPVEE